MGRIPNGINGPIVGKVGTVIGSSRNGKPYIKGPYKERKKDVTEVELGNRNKFGMSQYWLKPLLDFVREGYKSYKYTSGAFVAAKADLLRNAVQGAPDLRINPALVKLSVGQLPLATDIAVSKISANKLQFTWNGDTVAGSNQYDQVMMLAYNVDNAEAYYNITGQFRSAGSDTLIIDAPGTGKTYHLYMAFTSHDRESQSNSIYLGTIDV
jgi:hypothetical protein